METLIPGRLIWLQGRLARPYWGLLSIWAVLCGALASHGFRWNGEDLLALALVLLLVDLGWGNLWDLMVGIDWFSALRGGWPPRRPASTPRLPYTQPDSPAWRVWRRINHLAGWWRDTFWPTAGAALLGVLVAVLLTVVISFLLPASLRRLNAAVVALLGLGAVQRRWGRGPLAGEAFAQVGLGWLAGHLAFAGMALPSFLVALGFVIAIWGSLRLAQGRSGALALLDGGQAAVVVVLVAVRQPLLAGAVGALILGQVALQPALHHGADPAGVFRRTWPWLMTAMLVAALALP
ncbi:MAG: hypothetical protein M8467_15195 [Anaerolineae bacterium]|nr:hypothetical protein [Anaerolineae bacterium]